jgi:F420-non-reducing hydrogenase small subunit
VRADRAYWSIEEDTVKRIVVCDECPRLRLGGRLHRLGRHLRTGSRACLLEKGILCCGPATPVGCGALCPSRGTPCIGCRIAARDARGFEAAVLAALAPRVRSRHLHVLDACVGCGLRDPVGRLREYQQARLLLARVLDGPGRPAPSPSSLRP